MAEIMFLSEEVNCTDEKVNDACIHCGAPCTVKPIHNDRGSFCCHGCLTVFEILQEAGLHQYYKINPTPGSTPVIEDYSILDQPEILETFVKYKDTEKTKIVLNIPSIHCASCVWLLEKLSQLTPGVICSRVNLGRRELSVTYDHAQTSLNKLFTFLSSIGYPPEVNLSNQTDNAAGQDIQLIKRTALAGFCFGNIMLFSFPAYFGLETSQFYRFFGTLNALLAIPVATYCAADYWKSGKAFIKERAVTVDLPIFTGLIALTVQSYYEFLSKTGEGYFDSLSGLIFFLLCGKMFQNKLYQNLCFERDYKSFFPLWARKVENNSEKNCLVNSLKIDETLRIRQNELIPCDSELLSEKAKIDYSFVTGEYEPVILNAGDKIYAGGRQIGSTIDLKVTSECSTSYLTGLWNELKNNKSEFTSFSDKISRHFTPFILTLALILGSLWYQVSLEAAVKVFISVLIIACPCALALSAPFTYGFASRILNSFNLYLKNGQVIEKLSNCDAVIFDKTGTLSTKKNADITYSGTLAEPERDALFSLCSQSLHPVSRQICENIKGKSLPVSSFLEIPGCGLKGFVNGLEILIGSPKFAGYQAEFGTWVKIDGEIKGCFNSHTIYRDGLTETLKELSITSKIFILSGDNSKEYQALKKLYGGSVEIHFNQSPQDKMNFIKSLNSEGFNTLMIGDGLNDAGALSVADTGIAVTEDNSHFFPACDALLDARHLKNLHKFHKFSRWCLGVIHFNFTLSIIYNILGISAAALGLISPLFCAILMPASSFTILLNSALGTYIGNRLYLKETY